MLDECQQFICRTGKGEVQRFFARERSVSRQMNIFLFTESYLLESILMWDVSGITISRKRNGGLMKRRCFTAVPRSLERLWITIFLKRKNYLIAIFQWMKSSITSRCLFRGCGSFMYSKRGMLERRQYSLSNI